MFALKGSKYELEFDSNGNKLNEDEVETVLQNKRTDAYARYRTLAMLTGLCFRGPAASGFWPAFARMATLA